MFSSVGSQIAQFMKQKQSERSLRKLSRRLLRVREEERRRIARQLHDTTAQRLAVLKFNLSRLSNQGHHLTREAQKVAAESLTQVDKAIQEVRTLAYALHPPELHQFGLAAALEAYVKEFSHRSGIETELNLAREIDRLPHDIRSSLFWIVQEALTNIYQHSGSSLARIEIMLQPTQATVQIRDQGRGPKERTPRGKHLSVPAMGVGTSGMRERARELGGHLEISSDANGTTVRVNLPTGSGKGGR